MRSFRIVALVETVSWLVMLGAVIAKYAFDVAGATTVVGPVHGVIFLVYLGSVLHVREQFGWNLHRTVVAVAAAVIPLGAALLVEHRPLPQ